MIPNGIYFRQNLIEIFYTPLGLFNLVPVLIYGRSDERKGKRLLLHKTTPGKGRA
jgi:hypothetical protein